MYQSYKQSNSSVVQKRRFLRKPLNIIARIKLQSRDDPTILTTITYIKFEAQNGRNDPNQMTHIAVQSKHRLNGTEIIAHIEFHYRDYQNT